MGRAFHCGQVVGCPRCNARVRAKEAAYMGKASVDVVFWCPGCSEDGRYQPVDSAEEWTAEEREKMVDDYRRNNLALCPDDGGRVWVIPDPSLGSTRLASVSCPICGKRF